MKRADHIYNAILSISFVLLFIVSANAQIDFRRPSGMRGSTTQTPETPQPPVRAAPSGEEMNNALAGGLREFVVEPDENSASIKFKAPSGSAPVVEIGLEPPRPDPSGKLEFSSRLKLVAAAVVTEKNALQQVNFKADISGLERGTRYYYLVSTANGRLQTQDRFTTVSSTVSVKVVYTEIDVTNDSDSGGNGELAFKFFTNGDVIGMYGALDNLLSWNDTDPPRQINESRELSNVPNVLVLAVNGVDDDSVGIYPDIRDGFPFTSPGDRGDWEFNVATQSFNLNDYPEKYQRVDFVLNSMPQAAGQGDLSFIVKGYFEIRRERVN